MNTSRKVSTRTVLASGALALSFAIGSAGSAMAGPMAPERTTSFGQSAATHEVGSNVEQHYRTLTADQIAARQQLRTDIVALVSAMRAGDEVAAQAALTKVMSDIKAVKAADAAAAAAKDPKDSRDEQKGDDDSTEAQDPADSQDSKDSTEARPVAMVVKKDRAADPKRSTDWSASRHDGQAHSAAWHNTKSWSSAHDSRDRHDGDHRDRRGRHGSRHGDHHRSGR
ncbi:hypothetical protein [Oryzihumus leptocrescens]|uniref:Uncharacterized protein n=1 Tax=Oryzihumus leptocrescens TaxID=297536 RepID=A0A542ZMG0_9MICO|nr:hypothetical protein [Oryzihumus leptocrescens]TQL61390.1 hypothetical protein FB474_2799 [Oryzihumus leptocrescens]